MRDDSVGRAERHKGWSLDSRPKTHSRPTCLESLSLDFFVCQEQQASGNNRNSGNTFTRDGHLSRGQAVHAQDLTAGEDAALWR